MLRSRLLPPTLLRIAEAGQVFTFGKGDEDGRLGHAEDIESKSQPTPVRALEGVKVLSISLGFNHSVALTDNCLVYSWGRSEYGQLGHNDIAPSMTPRMVESLCDKGVHTISTGAFHTCALGSELPGPGLPCASVRL